MTQTVYYPVFNFQKNRWLYDYLNKYVVENKDIKSLRQVKELSIDILEKVFRKKGFFTKHNRENWLTCAEKSVCSGECRNSNGFKNDLDIFYGRNKCVPYTRKVNPKSEGFKFNDNVQYAYAFLQHYNSILYTLKNYKLNNSKHDAILRKLMTANSIKKSVNELKTAYQKLQQEELKHLTEKIKELKKNDRERYVKSLKKKQNYYKSEFDKKLEKMNAVKTGKSVKYTRNTRNKNKSNNSSGSSKSSNSSTKTTRKKREKSKSHSYDSEYSY